MLALVKHKTEKEKYLDSLTKTLDYQKLFFNN